MRDFITWNISKGSRKLARADAFIVSFPKSGRTWVRVFYYAYLSALAGREFSWNGEGFPGRPKVVFTHDRWQHRLLPGWWNFIRGRHLIPPRLRQERKIVLMVRDPRDVTVSLYFHLSKRAHVFKWAPQPLSEMLRDPKFGVAHVVELMNTWLAEWDGKANFLLIRYEDCRADAAREFRRLLEFVGLGPVDERALAQALDYSSFEKMQAREAEGKLKEDELSAGNRQDKDSFKTRKGKVGGFREHFNAADLEFAAREVARLDPRFNYKA